MLYLVNGQDTKRTRLALVKRKAIPFPPEPFRWFFLRLCQWAIKSAGDATMFAGYSSEPKFSIDFISAALRSRGCSPRAIFSLSTK